MGEVGVKDFLDRLAIKVKPDPIGQKLSANGVQTGGEVRDAEISSAPAVIASGKPMDDADVIFQSVVRVLFEEVNFEPGHIGAAKLRTGGSHPIRQGAQSKPMRRPERAVPVGILPDAQARFVIAVTPAVKADDPACGVVLAVERFLLQRHPQQPVAHGHIPRAMGAAELGICPIGPRLAVQVRAVELV